MSTVTLPDGGSPFFSDPSTRKYIGKSLKGDKVNDFNFQRLHRFVGNWGGLRFILYSDMILLDEYIMIFASQLHRFVSDRLSLLTCGSQHQTR
jgi:hypothetical protein